MADITEFPIKTVNAKSIFDGWVKPGLEAATTEAVNIAVSQAVEQTDADVAYVSDQVTHINSQRAHIDTVADEVDTKLAGVADVATSGSYDDLSGTPSPDLTYISADTTLTSNTSYGVDFTSPRTLTLPATPATDDVINIFTTAGDSTGSTIARNGKLLMGYGEDMTIDFNAVSIKLIYTGTDWRIV